MLKKSLFVICAAMHCETYSMFRKTMMPLTNKESNLLSQAVQLLSLRGYAILHNDNHKIEAHKKTTSLTDSSKSKTHIIFTLGSTTNFDFEVYWHDTQWTKLSKIIGRDRIKEWNDTIALKNDPSFKPKQEPEIFIKTKDFSMSMVGKSDQLSEVLNKIDELDISAELDMHKFQTGL